MMLAFIVWLVMTALPALKVLGVSLAVVSVLSVIISAIQWSDYKNDKPLNWTRFHLKWAIPVMLLAAFIPSEKTAWYMVGAYATQTVVQSEQAKQFAGDGMDVLHSLMKKAKQKIDAYDVEDAPKEAKAK